MKKEDLFRMKLPVAQNFVSDIIANDLLLQQLGIFALNLLNQSIQDVLCDIILFSFMISQPLVEVKATML